MKNLILLISLACFYNFSCASAQINLIEKYENGFISETDNSTTVAKQPNDLTISNSVGADTNFNEENIMSDLIRKVRKFDNLKNEQFKNLQENHETIETLNYALEAIQDLVCNKMERGELTLNNLQTLNIDCDNF